MLRPTSRIGLQWFLLLPLAFLVGPILGFGLLGIWLLQGGSRALQAIVYLSLWKGGRWRSIAV